MPAPCATHQDEFRTRFWGDTLTYGRQCQKCGRWVPIGTELPPGVAVEPPAYDPKLEDRYWEGLTADQLLFERIEQTQEFQEKHRLYLQTQQWKDLRQAVLCRSGGVCEGCRKAFATEVHHLNYNHWGNELLYELVALCSACHSKAHDNKGK